MKESSYKSYDDLPLFLNSATVAKVLGVAPSTAYELMHEADFPTLKIGNRIVVPKEQFIAQTLAVELYLEAGIRGVEIGSILADRDPETHENRYPALELLRLAIPRRVYTDNHIRVIAAACRNIFERRAEITTGYRITFEAPILRHFTVELDKIR